MQIQADQRQLIKSIKMNNMDDMENEKMHHSNDNKNTQDEAHYFVVFSVIKIVFCHFAGNLIFINNKTVAQVDQRLRLEMFIDQM